MRGEACLTAKWRGWDGFWGHRTGVHWGTRRRHEVMKPGKRAVTGTAWRTARTWIPTPASHQSKANARGAPPESRHHPVVLERVLRRGPGTGLRFWIPAIHLLLSLSWRQGSNEQTGRIMGVGTGWRLNQLNIYLSKIDLGSHQAYFKINLELGW